jgi:hypothetical protein
MEQNHPENLVSPVKPSQQGDLNPPQIINNINKDQQQMNKPNNISPMQEINLPNYQEKVIKMDVKNSETIKEFIFNEIAKSNIFKSI